MKLAIFLFILAALSQAKLKFIVEMYRHGARGQVTDFFYDSQE